MQENPYSGKFIVFEGLDGSGQTTQANLLKEFLEGKGKNVLYTKEPTKDSNAGRKIYDIVQKKVERIPAKDLQQLFIEDRREHLKQTIIPALENGTWIVADRYLFSTVAYGAAEGADVEWLIEQNSEFLYPDAIFLLKVNPAVCAQRIEKRGKARTIFEEQEKLEKIWFVYETLARRFENVYVIQGEQAIEKVAKDVQNIVEAKLV